MAAKYSRHVALTSPLVDFVEKQVALGNYASVSDIVRAALRLLQERDEAAAAAHALSVSVNKSPELSRVEI